MLIVDYHETNLLTQLNDLNYEDLRHPDHHEAKQENEKDPLNPNPVNTNQLEQDNRDAYSYENNQEPLADFNQPNQPWKQQMSKPKQDDEHNRNKSYSVDMMPTRLNSLTLDRYAYTSNCPTKYTDPSGHCDLAKALGGGLLMIGGGIVGAVGLVIFSTGNAAIIALQVEGLGGVAIGGITGFIGLGIAGFGGYLIYQSGCIPGLSP